MAVEYWLITVLQIHDQVYKSNATTDKLFPLINFERRLFLIMPQGTSICRWINIGAKLFMCIMRSHHVFFHPNYRLN